MRDTTIFNDAANYERFMGRWSRAISILPPHSEPVGDSSIDGVRAAVASKARKP